MHFQLDTPEELHTVYDMNTDTPLGRNTRLMKEAGKRFVLEINFLKTLFQGANPTTIYQRSVDFIRKA